MTRSKRNFQENDQMPDEVFDDFDDNEMFDNDTEESGIPPKLFLDHYIQIMIPRVYFKITGDLSAAFYLKRCIDDNDSEGDCRGFHKLDSEWYDEGFSPELLDRCREQCKPWVEVSLHRISGVLVPHYRVKLEELEKEYIKLYYNEEDQSKEDKD